jgi:hypothetical protein
MLVLRGRSERRVALTMRIRLASAGQPHQEEVAWTENASARGVRAVTTRRWLPGEMIGIRPSWDKIYIPARVTYCSKISDRSFRVGLTLENPRDNWWVSFSSDA